MIRIGRLVVVAFIGLGALVLLHACGGGGGSSPTEPTHANVTGTWDAQISSDRDGDFTAVFTLSQTGTSVTGTYRTPGGASGDITGSVSGQVFTFTLTQTDPCSGTYTGSATVTSDNRRASGSYSGSDCFGSISASFTARRR